MTGRPVVANASPLIALAQIDCLELLQSLFGTITIPRAVAREIEPTVTVPEWIEQRELRQEIGATILAANLGRGESEAITLAMELEARLIILDERPARRLAQGLHLPIIGTLGILLAAKRRRLIPTVAPHLKALLVHDFRISPRLHEQVLTDAGESASPKS